MPGVREKQVFLATSFNQSFYLFNVPTLGTTLGENTFTQAMPPYSPSPLAILSLGSIAT